MAAQSGKTILCPNCGCDLKGVYAQANYGRVLLLDQCPRCGGIWFDNWELYHLEDATAKNLDTIDTDGFLAATPGTNDIYTCPVCSGTPLEAFKDANLPADSNIQRCPECNGLWLNRGELIKYEDHKNKLRSRRWGDAYNSDRMKEILDVNRQVAERETINRLSAVLNTRDSKGRSAADEGTCTEWRNLTNDAMFLILQILLKIIFKI